jgi:hypothetical protein
LGLQASQAKPPPEWGHFGLQVMYTQDEDNKPYVNEVFEQQVLDDCYDFDENDHQAQEVRNKDYNQENYAE